MADTKPRKRTSQDELGLKRIVQEYLEKRLRFKKVQQRFNTLKDQFNCDMNDYFESKGIEKSFILRADNLNERDLIISRVQKSSVEFDPDKLEKVLGKRLSEQVIIKRYEVTDMASLVAYLKERDVDPKIFKSFITTLKSVDVQELDRLEDFGKITVEQVKDCYTIKRQKPYFTVCVKRERADNGEQRW